ncbi:hypothetical protein Misp01_57750 [Microtetraspora sp. NBRC 13810]|uniref:DUF1349 domain-containing protein n=1 Tax=Microtetraspora sp. NBRC 13810 TaxID=3030990 RepID=UPI0024A57EE2|nr:DUF1349 domain-containing protein [Microtetraspora sp. NBRC 13810]GLW10647.1 hypothetical protein Misp01_57750 [Microtetraspora sp. NBRC 13810]
MSEAFGLDGWQWVNEPKEWTAGAEELRVVCDGKTDLWRTTHYGFIYDNAHMFVRPVPGDLRLTVTFRGGFYAEQYDQAGAVLRIDENNWIKAGVEYVDGALQLSAVVTREFSDWGVTLAPGRPESVTFDLRREGDTVTVRYGLDGAEPDRMLRLAYFPPGVPALAGAMCAAPVGSGFPVTFTGLTVEG